MTVDSSPVSASVMSAGLEASAMSDGDGDDLTVAETPGDQRAAGVIRGDDPYRELELYLEKVQDELGEVFEQWKTSSRTADSSATVEEDHKISNGTSEKLVDVVNATNDKNSSEIKSNGYARQPIQRRKERLNLQRDTRHRNGISEAVENTNGDDDAWSESIIADVNSIILEQLRELEADQQLNASPQSSTYSKALEIREPRDQYTQTTPNSLSPTTSSVTWASEYSLYDTCRDGMDEDNKSTTTCSSFNDEARNSKEELSCECLSSGDSLDGISGSCTRKRCWLGLGRRSFSVPSGTDSSIWTGTDDAMTQTGYEQPSSAENLLMDSRSEEVDSGIGILSDGDKINGHQNQLMDDDAMSDKQTLQLILDLGTKSSSDPVLKQRGDDDNMSGVQTSQKKSYSQSDQQLTEIEVVEACKWLKAAGFPQYAQMYEELPFPVDLSKVKEDHPFLDPDSLRSLYRRLGVLNRCALLRLDVYKQQNKLPPPNGSSTGAINAGSAKSGGSKKDRNKPSCSRARLDDSDDEDNECALSEAWTYQTRARRWSRIDDPALNASTSMVNQPTTSVLLPRQQTAILEDIGAGDEALLGATASNYSQPADRGPPRTRDDLSLHHDLSEFGAAADPAMLTTLPLGTSASSAASCSSSGQNFHRTNSERIRDSAKAFLRHVESFKTRRRKRQNREGVVISDPHIINATLEQKLSGLNCSDITPSPIAHTRFLYMDDTSSCCSEGSSVSGHSSNAMSTGANEHHGEDKPSHGGAKPRRFLQPSDAVAYDNLSPGSARSEDVGTLSDSECHQEYFRDANSNHTAKPECSTLDRKTSPSKTRLMRSGSLVVKARREAEPQPRPRRDSDSNISTYITRKIDDFSPKGIFGSCETPRMRWHSFQEGPRAPAAAKAEAPPLQNLSLTVALPNAPKPNSIPIVSMSCGQLQLLRKLALVTLTGYMEKYCPTHRTGWNWELPKFIRKVKTPDYKDKVAFGVPLAITMQRTGNALPRCIQKALAWLQNNALEQVGLFRKSGVKSRIQSLKLLIEAEGDAVSFDGQQAYDVADVVKQYFRELPEALLTNKLSETFIAIFQDLPECKQHDAISCAILLLPDEHREALQTLLEFLSIVAEQVHHNQMTIRNIAVCLAPSLFHSAHGHNSLSLGSLGNGTPSKPSISPRRKKANTGIPDVKELNATKASHDCLQFLIKEHKSLFRVSQVYLDKCNFNYMDESIPLLREQLGADTDQTWVGYQYECTSALLKEARKESRGWVSIHTFDPLVDLAYKKVGDGHPLRLWRVTTEVEAPPVEVLNSILHERPVWDSSLLRCFVVERPEKDCDVFCYTTASMASLPPREFCVVRSWSYNLNKGACAMVETSVKRPPTYTSPPGTPKSGNVYFGAVTGIVLASRYFVEPCGSGRSKVMHLSRVDTKGRTLEFYTKIYGHICASQLTNLRKAFVIKSEGPESKV